jgi:hypothetical protein
MGINDEYSRDAYLPEDVGPDGDLQDDDPFDEFTQEDWEDWYSEELLDMWMPIRESYESQYLRPPLTFNEFCNFVYNY